LFFRIVPANLYEGMPFSFPSLDGRG
jgi:hypothetical protein